MDQANNSKVQEVVRKFFEAGNKQDIETLAGLVAPNLIVNNPLFGQGNVVTREVFKSSLDNMRKAFPDLPGLLSEFLAFALLWIRSAYKAMYWFAALSREYLSSTVLAAVWPNVFLSS